MTQQINAAAIGTPTRTPSARPGITAVADSTGACLARLRPAAFTDLAAGRLGVAARPGMRRVNWLGSDILAAFGCDPGTTGAGRPGDARRDVVVAWLLAHRIHDLYVQFAWSISYAALDAAVDLAEQARVHLWLVGDSPYSDRHAERLEPRGAREWTEQQFLQHWADLLHPDVPPLADPHDGEGDPQGSAATRAGWPQNLPNDDFTTFRAACRDLLTPAAFTVVDDHYRGTHAEATASLLPILSGTTATAVTSLGLEGTVAGWFAERWEDAETWQHFLVLVRAAQAAAFRAGYLLQVDLDQLLGTARTTPRRAQRNPATWQRLHAIAEPHRTAACALAAAGLGIDQMADLTLDSYDPATGVATAPDGQRYTVEPAARIFVEAQKTLRRLGGARSAGALLAMPDGRRLQPRSLATTVRQVRRELGVAVALPEPDRTADDPKRWYRRWGIAIQELK